MRFDRPSQVCRAIRGLEPIARKIISLFSYNEDRIFEEYELRNGFLQVAWDIGEKDPVDWHWSEQCLNEWSLECLNE